MNRTLESLIAQWRLCRGDKCEWKQCRRCQRGTNYRAKQEGNPE